VGKNDLASNLKTILGEFSKKEVKQMIEFVLLCTDYRHGVPLTS